MAKTLDIAALAAGRVAGFDPKSDKPGLPYDLETLLTHPDGLGLRTASPLQRAICRVMDGSPLKELRYDPDVIEAFGGVLPSFNTPPTEMEILSAIRSGKSLIVAARAVQMTQTCDVSGLVPGETPRTPVISLSKDLAQVVFGYVCALVQGPMFRHKMVGDPTADTVVVRHPTGRPIEIKVTAGSRAGSSVVARWLAGIVFDEAPRMLGSEEGVVNLDDTRSAASGRILPGTSMLYVGSPWAPFGPAFEFYRNNHGKPTTDAVAVKAPGWVINPVYWTQERCEELKKRDPAAYETDCAANFADKVLSFLSSDGINACIRKGVPMEPPQPGVEYIAAMDPATRGNAWTLGVAGLSHTGVKRLSLAKQWQGSTAFPLSPESVFEEMAHDLRTYGITRVYTDQWAYDALSDIAAKHGIYLMSVVASQQSKVNWFSTLRSDIIDKKVSLLDIPDLAPDLKRVQRKVTQEGLSIQLPKTSDGRHCDYAAMAAILFSRYFPEPGMGHGDARNPQNIEKEIERGLLEEYEVSRWQDDL